ncbi:MFS transporter, SP family, inositol transporter [Plantibacter sp. VKM Ac-1784]|uniref:MFS transporter, SP family, inositol transporter n=1 Tax=Plantibacter elymi (nom. nud.) TaxID=199708 RepID=A0ABY1REC0_9MICO|nr:MFS transporter [Plantibacter sp. VKM Ac-1784]SMQ71290.1 MFS transporter, SP family, inositol transporter [Plantibacter sp. VKM Ac-1784]
MNSPGARGSNTTSIGTIQRVGVYKHPWRVAIIAGLASFVDGAALTVNGIALVIYQQTIGLSANEVGLLSAVVAAGLAIGALVGGRLGDLYGRRTVFIVTMLMIAIGALAPTFSTNFWVLLGGLTLVGLGVGADLPVSLATIAEAAKDSNRGKMLVFTQVMWNAASLTTVILTTATSGLGRLSGQILYGMIVAVAVIGLVLRLTVPESPLWLQAREDRRNGVPTVDADKGRIRDLFQTPYRRPFIVLSSYYALALSGSTIVGGFTVYVGVNIVGLEVSDIVPYSLVLFPLAFVALFLFMKYVDTRFRIPLLLIGGTVLVAGLLIPVVFGFSLVTLLAALLICSLGATSAGEPLARVWSNEAFPTMLRSTAQGFVFTFGRLLNAGVTALIPALIAFNPSVAYVASAAAAALGVLIGWVGFRKGRIANTFERDQLVAPDAATPVA